MDGERAWEQDDRHLADEADGGELPDETSNSSWHEFSETPPSFIEQFERGTWPIRMPIGMEFYAEGWHIRCRNCEVDDEPRMPGGQVITVILKLDRVAVRDILLNQLNELDDPARKLGRIITLVQVDRRCFLDTIAAYFVSTLGGSGQPPLDERRLAGAVGYLNEFDAEVVPQMVAETINADRVAGMRLRELILDVVNEQDVRERMGWLVVATLTDRLQEL
jgi:hypothetical protein